MAKNIAPMLGFAFIVLAFRPAPSLGQAEPTLAEVQRHVEQAAGPRLATERIVINFTRSELSGTEVRLTSPKGYRIDTTTGPIHTASGLVGGVAWRQNANGETVTGGAPIGGIGDPQFDAFDQEERVTKLTHVHEPSDLYVISTLTLQGFGTKEYVDPQTWHVVRRERITPTETRVTTYDDFRTVAGRTSAWHWTYSDGHEENDASYTIASIDTTAVSDADLAIPQSRAFLEFPAGQTSVQLPAHLDGLKEKFIVRLVVNGRGLDFLFDTGASGIVIERDVARSLGLKEYGSFSNAVNAGRYVGTYVVVPQASVGALMLHDAVVQTIPESLDQGEDYKVVGLLGFDFIAQIAAKLDYAHGTLTAYEPSAFVPPTDPRTNVLDVRLDRSVPDTDVVVNGVLGRSFAIDTGGVGALMITDAFRRENPAAVVDEDHHTNPKAALVGVGGEFDARRIKLAEVDLGKVRFTDYYAYVMDSPKLYSGLDDGIIGPILLRLFDVYTDYANKKLYMAPNAGGASAITP